MLNSFKHPFVLDSFRVATLWEYFLLLLLARSRVKSRSSIFNFLTGWIKVRKNMCQCHDLDFSCSIKKHQWFKHVRKKNFSNCCRDIVNKTVVVIKWCKTNACFLFYSSVPALGPRDEGCSLYYYSITQTAFYSNVLRVSVWCLYTKWARVFFIPLNRHSR